MTGKAVLFGLLLLYVTAGEKEKDPSIAACPMNFAPLCGSDGNTYANESVFNPHNCSFTNQSKVLRVHQLVCFRNICRSRPLVVELVKAAFLHQC
uniref:Kazal-like domain-containing protein n=1 Tax=Oryzias sinensis TaxID=183150 RepID=A0A8C7YPI2_9TELE